MKAPLQIHLTLILTFFVTRGLTFTIEKREIPGQSLQTLLAPLLITLALIIIMILILSFSLVSKLSKDNIDVKTVFYTDSDENTQGYRTSTSTNYVLDIEEQTTVSPNTNTFPGAIRRIQTPTILHTNSSESIQTQTSRMNLTRTMQNELTSTSIINSTPTLHENSNRTIERSLSRANTVRTIKHQRSAQNPAIYSYI